MSEGGRLSFMEDPEGRPAGSPSPGDAAPTRRIVFPIGMRLALGTMALVLGVLLLTVTSWVSREARLVRGFKRNEAQSLAVSMASAWSNELIDENWNQIREQFREVSRDSGDVVYLLITDERRAGRIVAAIPEELTGTYVPDVVPVEITTLAREASDEPRVQETFLLREVRSWDGESRAVRGERIVEVATDIRFERHRVGVLRVGVSLRALDAARRDVLQEAGLFGGLSLLIGVIGALFLARQITGPIRRLEESASRMASGQLEVRSTVTSRDEIGHLSGAFNRMADNLERSFARLRGTLTSFERFVPRKFLSVVAPDGIEKIQVGNRATRTITILFSDIRGYTSISENSTAMEMFDLLNDYLPEMGAAIDAHGGFIDKYIGDAIMALFDDEATDAAVRAALAMRERLVLFNARRVASGRVPIDIGIGLHRGEVVMGAVGFATRIDSTVIGDPVNLASRVEGLTKMYGVGILVTEAVRAALSDPEAFQLEVVDAAAKVKGKDEAVVLYSVRAR
jgi:class 3 adenylate cyclase